MTSIKRTIYVVVPVEIVAANDEAFTDVVRDVRPLAVFGGSGPHGLYRVTSGDPVAVLTEWPVKGKA